MESIRELREICQPSLEQQRKKNELYAMWVSYKLSIYVTWLLLHTSITANQVTFLFIITGLGAGLLLSIGEIYTSLAGVFLLQFWYILDCVDGEIARYRKTTGITGAYYDYMTHFVVHPFIFLCLGIGVFNFRNSRIDIYLGGIAALSSFLMPLNQMAKISLFLDHPKPKKSRDKGEKPVNNNDNENNARDRVNEAISLFTQYPGIMNVITIAAFIEWRLASTPGWNYPVFHAALIFYAIILTALWVKVLYSSVTNGIEAEHDAFYNKFPKHY